MCFWAKKKEYYKKMIDDLKKEKESLEERNLYLRDVVDDLSVTIENNERVIQELDGQIIMITKSKEDLEDQLVTAIDNHQKEIEKLKDDIESARMSFEEELELKDDEINHLLDENYQYAMENSDLQRKIHDLYKENQSE